MIVEKNRKNVIKFVYATVKKRSYEIPFMIVCQYLVVGSDAENTNMFTKSFSLTQRCCYW